MVCSFNCWIFSAIGLFFSTRVLVSVEGFCRFGDDPDCVFPCLCTSGCDTMTGECINGGECQYDDPPQGYIRRSGPACQIGNIARGKPAFQEGTFQNLVAALATDGNIVSDINFCAHPDSAGIYPERTWWYVDLLDTYTVVGVTVFNRNGYWDSRRTGNFKLGVGNVDDVHQSAVCKYYAGPVPEGGNATIQCDSPLTGRYVSILRTGGYQPMFMGLCEVMVHGYKPIECNNERCYETCNDVVGCETCSVGYMYPGCNPECENGNFGLNCQLKCDNCAKYDVNSVRYCGLLYGTCYNGCLDGYHGDACTERCSEGCRTISGVSTCQQNSGQCVSGCKESYFGDMCQYSCGSGCFTVTDSNTCDRDSGACSFGCQDGYFGANCTSKCNNMCLKVAGKPTCEKQIGECTQGCIPGYHGRFCERFCSTSCRFQPGRNTSSCSQTTGKCDHGCIDGRFGFRCKEYCRTGCLGAGGQPVCDRENGFCSTGCLERFYGEECQYNCSSHCLMKGGLQICERDSGACSHGCIQPQYDTWYAGETCDIQIVYLEFPYNQTVEIENITSESVTVGWQELTDIPRNLSGFFGYRIYISDNSLLVSRPRSRIYIDRKVGEDKEKMRYTLSGLSQNTTYIIRIYICRKSSNGKTEESKLSSRPVTVTTLAVTGNQGSDGVDTLADNNTGMISGSVVGAIVVAALIILLIIFLVRKKRFENPSLPGGRKKIGLSVETALDTLSMDDMLEDADPDPLYCDIPASKVTPDSTSINLQDLEKYIHEKKYKPEGLKKEFTDIPNGELKPSTVANSKENLNKNRFKNIKPYDHNRVALYATEEENQTSDFINASFIIGYPKIEKHYVATQGPKPHTIVDFWRMLWQLRSNRIVMVTRLIELGKQKCEQYWPEAIGTQKMYGHISITTTSIDFYADYALTVLTLKKGEEYRTVKHLQFVSWPDKQSPEHAFPLLAFRRKLRSFDKEGTGPIVVHCSAGVGRTGTFIALDYLLDQMEEGTVDIVNLVTQLRYERMNMIQTFSQYLFLYEALLEAYQQGETAIRCDVYPQRYKQLVDGHEYNNETQIEAQLKVLSKLKVLSVRPGDKSALFGENIKKNRDIDITPENKHRLFLTTRCPGTTDYINAVMVHSFLSKEKLIVTQMPLADTVVDFWRLVYEYKCHTIVTLQAPDIEDQNYWSIQKDEEVLFGALKVKLTALHDGKDKSTEIREFHVTYSSTTVREEPVSVRHILFTKWSSNQTLPDKDDFLSLIDCLQKSQQQNINGKLIIQCVDGASRSGLFCAAHYMLEKMKADNEVDVFLAVRAVALPRHQFVNDLAQYRYLHDIAMEFISRNAIYGNFK